MDNINRLPSEPKTENNQVSLTPKVNEQSVNAQESSKYVNSNVVASERYQTTPIESVHQIQNTTLQLTDKPISSRSSPTKKVLVISLMLLLLLLIITSGYYLHAQYLNKEVQKSAQQYPTPTSYSVPQPTKNPSQNVETITNSGAETLILDKPVSIIGEGPNKTIIHCSSEELLPFILSHSQILISDMTIRDCKYGLKVVANSEEGIEDIQIYNVIFENNKLGGILIENNTPNAPVSFQITNSVFSGGSSGIIIKSSNQGKSSKIENNIFFNQTIIPINIVSENDGVVNYSYNLFFGCNGDCKEFWHSGKLNSSSKLQDNIFDLDPLFINVTEKNYELSPGSPAIDAGNPALEESFAFTDGDGDGIPRIDIGIIDFTF